MTVESQHPDYKKHVETWERVRAACEGQRAIKAGKEKFLPKPNADIDGLDPTVRTGNDIRYRQYIERAVYTNFCGRTLSGLKGAAFRKEPGVEIPTGLEYLLDNATGDGNGLIQLAKDSLSEVLAVGRLGYLVDYPTVDEGLSAEQTRGLEARILPYTAESVINWKIAAMDGQVKLVLLVLKESYNTSDDEFDHKLDTQYRVLRLRDGVYTQQVYRQAGTDAQGKRILESDGEVIPRNSAGGPFNFIPFCFVGSINNDFLVDPAPMESLAEVNIAHYRNSADLEENSFIHGQLTLGVTSSLSADQWKDANPAGIVVGARTGHFLGENGGFHSVQAEASSLTQQIMRDKEAQLVMLGAQLITDKNSNETAKAAQLKHASEHSVLGDICGNISDAICKCIEWCGEFMGVVGECEFEINRQFFDEGADPQMVMAAIQLYDREAIALSDLMDYGRKAGIVSEDRTNEDIEDDLSTEVDPDDLEPIEMPEQPKAAKVYDMTSGTLR